MLNARSVLVTGSNRGIGLELIRQLLGKSKRPEWIFATCRDPEGPRAQELKKLAAQHHEVKIIPLEITDSSSIQAAVTKVTDLLQGAGLNLLINNAGVAKDNSLESETAEDMAEVYKNNVIGPMMVTQAFLLLRKASQESRQKGMSCSKAAIINVSSEGGSITNILIFDLVPCIGYRCSKAALNMLTRCQSLGYAEDEILCVALHPGWVQTDMGGTEATMPVDASARAILNTFGRLTEKDNGTFVNWEGAGVPW
ncbi:PREDICTED: C-factor-like [Gekko japonicus]|uniref:C-factor-like n=1 Tax=Gekko japonicus TaxID=146911 RepID=A0ABM1JZN4_GEKJA|nr:PREDICTED: C-factor-like [Gekko japonicus]